MRGRLPLPRTVPVQPLAIDSHLASIRSAFEHPRIIVQHEVDRDGHAERRVGQESPQDPLGVFRLVPRPAVAPAGRVRAGGEPAFALPEHRRLATRAQQLRGVADGRVGRFGQRAVGMHGPVVEMLRPLARQKRLQVVPRNHGGGPGQDHRLRLDAPDDLRRRLDHAAVILDRCRRLPEPRAVRLVPDLPDLHVRLVAAHQRLQKAMPGLPNLGVVEQSWRRPPVAVCSGSAPAGMYSRLPP